MLERSYNLNNSNQLIPIDVPQTPAFYQVNSNRWGNSQDQWNNSSATINDHTCRFITNNDRKITQILSELFRKEPQRFDEALASTVGLVINEKQARIFFADHIHICNPCLSRDRLLRLFQNVQFNEQNKRLVGQALSQFRLEEVPPMWLPIDRQIVNIFEKIYGTVYVQDLLKPSLTIYQELIESYFNKMFPDRQQILQIEGERIRLAPPRNLLNVILFLNEYYQLPIDLIFHIYINKMVRHNQVNTLRKIFQRNVIQICELSRDVIESYVVAVCKDLLEENPFNNDLVEEALSIMNPKNQKIFMQWMDLFEYLSNYSINFKARQILRAEERNTQYIIRNIIIINSIDALSKIRFPFLFLSLGRIEGIPQTYYLQYHIKIIKQVSQLLLKNKYYQEGLDILEPLLPILRRSFIASMLIRHFNAKYTNRLASPKNNITDIFKEIFHLISELPSSPSGDSIPDDDQNWLIFSSFCLENLRNQNWEVAYLIYKDKYLAKELIHQQIFSQSEYQYITEHIRIKIPIQGSYKEFSNQAIHIPLELDIYNCNSNSSTEFNKSYFSRSLNQPFIQQQSSKCFESIDKELLNVELCRSLKKQKDNQLDPSLISLKIQVQKQTILKMLSQIYEEHPRGKFLIAINLVDKERIPLYNIELYKSLVQSKINYPFQFLIPFEYFIGQKQSAWLKIFPAIRAQIDEQNFWTIYLLIGMLYNKESQIAFAFIEKIILYKMDDELYSVLQTMLKGVRLEREHIQELRINAQQRHLWMIKAVIDNIQDSI